MILVENLCKSFGTIEALQGLSFVAEPGLITGLLGPNGAGKSTAMRLISGTLRAASGRVLIDGVDMNQDPMRAKSLLGILGDARGLYGRLSARENIEYYGRLRGIPRKQMLANLSEIITTLKMEDIIDQKTAGMSTGQKVKVALARALLHDPPNILLDEPSSGLDVLATKSMRAFIKSLRDNGRTIIFTSHITQEVAEVCDRIILVQHGKMLAGGTPDDLIHASGEKNLEDAILHLLVRNAESPA